MEDAAPKLLHLFMDTSYLWDVGLGHADLRKLLEYSKRNELKVFIPHIAWEEFRTRLLDKAQAKVWKVEKEFEALKAMHPSNLILGALPPPALTVWTKEEMAARSRETMAAFAEENKVEIVALAAEHGARAWQRYFDVGLPFSPDQERENRRKDIPDAWILEAAIDVKTKHPGLIALCSDGRLATALTAVGIRVCKKTQEVLDEIEQARAPQPIVQARAQPEMALPEQARDANAALASLFAAAQEQFKDVERKVLGFVAHLDSPTKDQLVALLARSGVAPEAARNVAERLALAGFLTDTGNHYLAANREAGAIAAASVEQEIIKLLESGG